MFFFVEAENYTESLLYFDIVIDHEINDVVNNN